MKHFRGKKLHLLDIQMYILTFPFLNNFITSILINALPLYLYFALLKANNLPIVLFTWQKKKLYGTSELLPHLLYFLLEFYFQATLFHTKKKILEVLKVF